MDGRGRLSRGVGTRNQKSARPIHPEGGDEGIGRADLLDIQRGQWSRMPLGMHRCTRKWPL